MAKKKKGPGIWAEFKEFINRGNALMLAVGVVIGGAFSAIVNAFVNMLLSLATWPVPGGLAGLVTPLYPLTSAQKGLGAGAHTDIGLTNSFGIGDLQELANKLANKLYNPDGTGTISDVQFIDAKNTITSNYTLYGKTYIYNQTAFINWGALINAFISFIIIAFVLFLVVKISNSIARKRAELKAQALEAYYQKHPEERPEPEEEKEPDPTEVDYLKRITEILEAQTAPKEEPKKKGKKKGKAKEEPEAKEEAPKEEAKEEPKEAPKEEPKPKKPGKKGKK